MRLVPTYHWRRHRGGDGGTGPPQTFQRLWAVHGKNRPQMVLVPPPQSSRRGAALATYQFLFLFSTSQFPVRNIRYTKLTTVPLAFSLPFRWWLCVYETSAARYRASKVTCRQFFNKNTRSGSMLWGDASPSLSLLLKRARRDGPGSDVLTRPELAQRPHDPAAAWGGADPPLPPSPRQHVRHDRLTPPPLPTAAAGPRRPPIGAGAAAQ